MRLHAASPTQADMTPAVSCRGDTDSWAKRREDGGFSVPHPFKCPFNILSRQDHAMHRPDRVPARSSASVIAASAASSLVKYRQCRRHPVGMANSGCPGSAFSGRWLTRCFVRPCHSWPLICRSFVSHGYVYHSGIHAEQADPLLSLPQRFHCVNLILPHLGDQVVHAGELRVAAQPVGEMDGDGLVVEVAVPADQVRFDGARAIIELRARAI